MGVFLLITRLLQTSLMVLFPEQRTQSAFASVVSLTSIVVERELSPYRRSSDNQIAVLARWLVFLWTFGLLLRLVHVLGSFPSVLVGATLVLASVGIIIWSLRAALQDTRTELTVTRRRRTATSQKEASLPQGISGHGPDEIELVSVTSEAAATNDACDHQPYSDQVQEGGGAPNSKWFGEDFLSNALCAEGTLSELESHAEMTATLDKTRAALRKALETIAEKDKAIDEKDKAIYEKDKAIDKKDKAIDEKDRTIDALSQTNGGNFDFERSTNGWSLFR